MSSPFLTETELIDLTGRQLPAAQAKVLRRNGIPYFVRADGHLRVPRGAVASPRRPAHPVGQEEPDLDAVKRLG